ncbi:MAG TPA: M48 family metalloprotease [Acidimicrobiales bacterium]|jgi:heat shock protein HtpX|nr:M48 family metalloprotease [Acidimicrobiales bacterium]
MRSADSELLNNRRRGLLVVAATVMPVALLFGAIGLLAGVVVAVVILVVVAGAGGTALWATADRRAVAGIGGVPADPRVHARLYNLVDGLCAAAGVAPPRLLVVDDAALNAVAVGRDPRRATLAVTTGLLRDLSRIELEAVLANELVRIKRRSTLPGTLAAGAGPLARRIAQRSEREEAVDMAAVALTRYPPGLASAFEKMASVGTALARPALTVAGLWLAEPIGAARAGHAGGGRGTAGERRPLPERVAALREL